jgi:hypothetical protein
MYGIPSATGGYGDGQQDDPYNTGDRLVDRIMAAEYNLSVQRNDGPQAINILARMLGHWLTNRLAR